MPKLKATVSLVKKQFFDRRLKWFKVVFNGARPILLDGYKKFTTRIGLTFKKLSARFSYYTPR